MPPPHDRLFKTLLRAFFADLVRLTAPAVAPRLRLGLLLMNFVEAYLELTPEESEEYKILGSRKGDREVREMWMTWSERIEAEGLKKGRHQGMRQLLLHPLDQKFGPFRRLSGKGSNPSARRSA